MWEWLKSLFSTPVAVKTPVIKEAVKSTGKVQLVADTAAVTTNYLAALKAAGYIGVIRYYTRAKPTATKHIKLAEAKAIKKAGMLLGISYEDGINISHFTEQNGYLDMKYCRETAAKLGQPSGSAVYLSIDFNPPKAQDHIIEAYFKGVQKAARETNNLPVLRVGCYSSGHVLRMLRTKKLIDLAWLSQSKSFLESKDFEAKKEYNLLQKLTIKVGGLAIDPNYTNPARGDVGLFTPNV